MDLTRREVLRRLGLAGVGVAVAPTLLAACGGDEDEGQATSRSSAASGTARTLAPTPACGDDPVTMAQTEGPFFETGSPEKASFVGDVSSGTRVVLAGAVLTTACRPVPRARLEFWHADDAGEYDNRGFRLRGHLFTDAEGRYRLETIEPGNYTGRTKHFHVKVQPPGGDVLTTQLYFPGERGNARDSIYRPELLMDVSPSSGGSGKEAGFTFVVEG